MKYEVQQEFFEFLNNEISKNKLSHAYLFETNDFTDIDKFLNILLKVLLCPNSEYSNSCNKCKICNLIDINNYPDIKVIEEDGQFIKKEQLLGVMDDFKNKSMYGNKQIYVIKDASKLNNSSGNTILKFLEEPSPNIIAILLVKNRYSVLETILSRCQVISLKNSENSDFSDDIYMLIKTLFSQNKGFLAFNDIIDFMPDKKEAVKKLEIIQKYFLDVVNGHVELLSDIKYLNTDNIYKIILIIEKYIANFQYNVNYKLAIDNFIIDISEVIS